MLALILISGTYALIPYPEEAYSNSAQRPPLGNSSPLQEPSYREEQRGKYKRNDRHKFYQNID